MHRKLIIPAIALVTALSACQQGYGGGYGGGTDLQRAAVGGVVGCALAVVDNLAQRAADDGKCITGAGVGAAAGALTN